LVRLLKTRQGRSDANGDPSERLVTVLDLTSVASEAYRTLRINLLYVLVDPPPKVIVVTSPGVQESIPRTRPVPTWPSS
jgi:hypothetical protein